MQILFDNFMNKEISPLELLRKIRKYGKYLGLTFDEYWELNNLIADIEDIIRTQSKQDQYENILIVFHAYLQIRQDRRNKIASSIDRIKKKSEI